MKISAFQFNPFGEMTYILWDPATREAAIVDPGMSNSRENEMLDDFITANNLKIKYILNTHLHVDHIFGSRHAADNYGLTTSASENDSFLAENAREQARSFGLSPDMADRLEIGNPLSDGDILHIGEEPLEVIATPGHSPGSLSFYAPESGFVMTGDTLFRRGIGRTDLPGGSSRQIADSIRRRLYTLPDSTLVVPGHGPTSTIGEERRGNPYV
ncbi:MAG: MBL fold metallo-hydrolase [Clostridium sp.]|nr:MBL fold metallo-hydrolase [Clostridium sp.]